MYPERVIGIFCSFKIIKGNNNITRGDSSEKIGLVRL